MLGALCLRVETDFACCFLACLCVLDACNCVVSVKRLCYDWFSPAIIATLLLSISIFVVSFVAAVSSDEMSLFVCVCVFFILVGVIRCNVRKQISFLNCNFLCLVLVSVILVVFLCLSVTAATVNVCLNITTRVCCLL